MLCLAPGDQVATRLLQVDRNPCLSKAQNRVAIWVQAAKPRKGQLGTTIFSPPRRYVSEVASFISCMRGASILTPRSGTYWAETQRGWGLAREHTSSRLVGLHHFLPQLVTGPDSPGEKGVDLDAANSANDFLDFNSADIVACKETAHCHEDQCQVCRQPEACTSSCYRCSVGTYLRARDPDSLHQTRIQAFHCGRNLSHEARVSRSFGLRTFMLHAAAGQKLNLNSSRD